MFTRFLSVIFESPYLLSIIIIGVFGVFFFMALPHSKKRKPENYLPFLLLTLVPFYENLGAYLNLDKAFNQRIHEWTFNGPFKGWNLWVFNLFNFQISKVIFLFIVLHQIKRKSFRWIIQGLWISFVAICIGLQWSGTEPLHDFQPIIYFLGNSILIIACGLFFIDLITSDFYLELNPLKMWSFWFITLTLFQSSFAFLYDVSYEYLASKNKHLFYSIAYISQFFYVAMMAGILIKFAEEILNFSRKKNRQNA